MPHDDPAAAGPDEDTLSETDQTSSDADQSSSDLDQTASENDQFTSDRDQLASDRDQKAADLDQEASDRAHTQGTDPVAYARTRRARSQTALERDIGTQARAEVSLVREATAARRDMEAEARDAAAAARDKLAAALDAEIERLENTPITRGDNESAGVVLLIHSLHNRRRAAASRARAAEQREAAARDREMAQLDRIAASADLRAAAEELAAEGVDHLTRALRRRVGLLALQREIDRTTRGRESLVVAFIDVDGLKRINDTQGHDAGDRVLSGVAESIAGQLRSYDVIMRFGGDEFVCSMAGQGLDAVRERFDEIATTMAATHDGASATVGLAQYAPGESLDEVIGRADRAMLAVRADR